MKSELEKSDDKDLLVIFEENCYVYSGFLSSRHSRGPTHMHNRELNGNGDDGNTADLPRYWNQPLRNSALVFIFT